MSRWLATAAAGLMTVGLALPASAHPLDEYTFEGGGWGHGVGMSQYGARAMGENGFTFDQILQHYYSGTEVQPVVGVLGPEHWFITGDAPLWVGLEQDLTSLDFDAVGGPLVLCHLSNCTEPDVTAQAGESWSFAVVEDSPGLCSFRRLSGAGENPAPTAGSCAANIIWTQDETVGVTTLGREYRRGTLRLRTTSGTEFNAALQIPVTHYLYGLGEMPSSWHEEALKAQVAAGRTYAAFRALEHGPEDSFSQNRKDACWCHLYDSTIDQAYVGWSKESEGVDGFWGEKWKAAVDATDGVVTDGGQVIQAFFMSSSGGVTENNSDVWNSAQRPYLVSVDDPWSVASEANNPFEDWTVTLTAQEIADAFGWGEVTSVAVLSGPPNAQVRFVGGDGEETTRSGPRLRTLFGLRSPHISGLVVALHFPFTDIEGNVHAEAIAAIWQAGITLGCGGDLFCPSETVTRDQMASFLARAADLPAATGDHFSDDSGTHEENINRIFEAGVTDGCGPDLYCPDDPVTRGQMAKFLVGALNLPLGGPNRFADDDGHRFEKYIDAVAGAEISMGCNPGGTAFCPDELVTRAQMASFLARAFLPGF